MYDDYRPVSDTKPTNALKVGDLFRCKKFAHTCQRNIGQDDLLSPGEGYEYSYTHTEIREIGGETWECSTKRKANTDRSDPSNGKAVFEVLDARYSGGGYGHGFHDVYPDGWCIRARRVDKPEVIIEFYQSGCFTTVIKPEDIERIKE